MLRDKPIRSIAGNGLTQLWLSFWRKRRFCCRRLYRSRSEAPLGFACWSAGSICRFRSQQPVQSVHAQLQDSQRIQSLIYTCFPNMVCGRQNLTASFLQQVAAVHTKEVELSWDQPFSQGTQLLFLLAYLFISLLQLCFQTLKLSCMLDCCSLSA